MPVEGDDLRIRPEPAARQVDGGQIGLQHRARRVKPAGVGDDNLDAGAEGPPACRRLLGGRPGGAPGHHEPPDVAWVDPEREAAAGADVAPAEPFVVVVATAEPPDVVCTAVPLP